MASMFEDFDPRRAIRRFDLKKMTETFDPRKLKTNAHVNKVLTTLDPRKLAQAIKDFDTNNLDPVFILQEINKRNYQSRGETDYDVEFASANLFDMRQQREEDVTPEQLAEYSPWARRKYRAYMFLRKESVATILFIPLLGIGTAVLSMCLDYLQMVIDMGRVKIAYAHPFWALNLLLWCLYCFMYCAAAASCISFISPYAVGAGIPEIKSILSGIDLSHVLSFRTLVAKFFGLTFALGGGLILGRTGPFMHIACCLAGILLNLDIFANIRRNDLSRFQMIVAACAAGVTANFGSPIGGILFAMEIAGTTTIASNLWKGILCAAFCDLSFYFAKELETKGEFKSMFSLEFVPHRFAPVELASFAVIGLVCGLLGAFLVACFKRLVLFRLKHKRIKASRIVLVCFVGVLTAILTFCSGPLSRMTVQETMRTLLLSQQKIETTMFGGNHYTALAWFILIKFLCIIFNVVLPIPGGIITPCLVLGAAVGRFSGELMNELIVTGVNPAGFAIVGAAGLVSGVTRALAPAVMIIEMTGQYSLLIPCLLCTGAAAGLGNLFNRDIFNTAVRIQKLPILQNFHSSKVYKQTAADVMRKDVKWVAMDAPMQSVVGTIADTAGILKLPVVESSSTMLFVGTIERASLERLVSVHRQMWETKYPELALEDALASQRQQQQQLEDDAAAASPTGAAERRHLVDGVVPPVVVEMQPIAAAQPQPQPPTTAAAPTAPSRGVKGSRSLQNIAGKLKRVMSREVIAEGSRKANSNANSNKLASSRSTPHLAVLDIGETVHAVLAEDNDGDAAPPPQPVEPDLFSKEAMERADPEFLRTLEGAEEVAKQARDAEGRYKVRHWREDLLGDVLNNGLEVATAGVELDLAPFTVSELTPLQRVFYLFIHLGPPFAAVLQYGRLIGVVTKRDLMDLNHKLDKSWS